MTSVYANKNKKEYSRYLEICLCLAVFIIAIYFGGAIKDGVIYGFKICFFNIIPTLFPFFILSDLWSSLVLFQKDSIITKSFEWIFGINGEGLSSFLLGNICGFPLGIKSATEKYDHGLIDKQELASLTAIANNPSSAFVISGVGLGLFSSIKVGFILYFSVIISAMIIGFISKTKIKKVENTKKITRQKFNLIESIKSAGLSSITVSSYIIFFSAVIGVIKSLTENVIAISVISSLLEIGSACSIIAEERELLSSYTLPMISFSLGFSGLSVFLQAFSILPESISKKNYLIKKLLQGILSAALTALLASI